MQYKVDCDFWRLVFLCAGITELPDIPGNVPAKAYGNIRLI